MNLLLRPHGTGIAPRMGIVTAAVLFVPSLGDTGARKGRLTWFETRLGEPGVLFPPPYEGPVDRDHDRDVHHW